MATLALTPAVNVNAIRIEAALAAWRREAPYVRQKPGGNGVVPGRPEPPGGHRRGAVLRWSRGQPVPWRHRARRVPVRCRGSVDDSASHGSPLG